MMMMDEDQIDGGGWGEKTFTVLRIGSPARQQEETPSCCGGVCVCVDENDDVDRRFGVCRTLYALMKKATTATIGDDP
jgi:hypothetical protein